MPPADAALFGLVKTYNVVTDTLKLLFKAVTGHTENVSAVGPVGIVKMARKQLEMGLQYFLSMMSYISLMLFLFNFMPVPALDGGRFAFLLYEIISGRRVNKKIDAMLNTVFFMLLMGVLVLFSIKELFFN
jgi:regulator of sigma E protease